MYRSCLKSKVFENQNPLMWCSKETNGAKIVASDSIGDYSITECKEPENEEQSQLRNPKAIVIVEPRQMRTTSPSTSTTTSSNPEWFMLPHTVDINNDVMRLVSSLSTVVQILTRMTNAAAQELRQHPEREEGFQGLRMLLNYADQMYTTLLQPQTFSMERSASQRNSQTQSYSLFHHLFEPMLSPGNRGEEASSRQAERPSAHRTYPYRVVSAAAESDASLDLSL
ncbi:uncharacterized protein LOC117782192 [Drosophila innubila]|uniref:uncharacterized protein LOC117782192 n=1 Tax=Drosophila innubila TaxID=198719 RepID=UPI00148CCF44|nr:uncharacterized protein LOC117782192 [Drosophila innubila]